MQGSLWIDFTDVINDVVLIIFRKDLVDEEVLNASDELSFSELVLTRKPKSADNFIHR